MKSREHLLSEGVTRAWAANFRRLPLSKARQVTAIWFKRAGLSPEQLSRVEDIHVLLQAALSARKRFVLSPDYTRKEAAIALDEAASHIQGAISMLEGDKIPVPGILNDCIGLLEQGCALISEGQDTSWRADRELAQYGLIRDEKDPE